MEDLPAPLVPLECDLRDFTYMPLDVVRLRDSDLASIDAEAFRAAVLSWCVAWHQSPAGSLPNDDAALCRLLGYGRDMKTWLKVRDAGALRGFVKCSDGRLYHPVVAEKAMEAWQKKIAQRGRTEAARLAKLAQKAGMSVTDYLSRQSQSLSQTDPPSVTDIVTDIVTSCVTGSKGEEGKGEEKKGDSKQPGLTQSPRDPGGDHRDRPPPTAENGFNGWEGGREVVGGEFWDMVWPRIITAARIDPARWAGNDGPARHWLRGRIPPKTIYAAIERVAERPDYVVPNSLGYFDKPVRERHGSTP